ncbi:hypothetical protein L7F22_054084 [Adiantum nelumboides]|nr:hypothetical protein [Adiantum nelumboides]
MLKPLPPPPPKVLSNAYTLFFDGAFRRATGKAGGGLVLVNPEGEVVMKEQVTLDGSTSNNEAEYDILISGLKICLAQKIQRLMVKGDALLIVKQILGIWACKNERLRIKVTSIRKLFNKFEEVQLYHIPRKENEDADLLAQQAVSNQDKAHMVIAAIALKDPQYAGMESLTLVVNYILEGEFPKEFTAGQRRKLIKQASTFLWLEGALYQKGKDLVCRRVPSSNEIPKVLKGLHEEACGGHFFHELTLKKVLLAGYVWPSMHADVQHWCRSCHNCQVNGNKRLLYGPRQAVIANGPFEKWGIDAMGPLPRTANGKLYILVAIDYMTRWVEAQSVAKVNENTVSKFVYTHICCRFGTPLEIVSDNGPGFRGGLLTEVCEVLKISHRYSTPCYPQSNGLVEKANGIITGIIRKMVESKPMRWDNFLDGAIWTYRTTYRDAPQFTPFHLVYGQEALQPIELNIPTIKLTGRQEQNNDEAWIDRLLILVELEWKREAAYHCYEKKALQLKDKLNEGIKDKEIKEKSLVLRYNNALDNRFDAKFECRWEGPFIVKKAFTGGYYQLMDLNGKEHPRKVNGYWLKPYLSRILPVVFETKQVSKKTKKVCCHCCSGTHQVKSCAFQHVLHEVAKDQKEKLSSPTSCPESSFQYNPVDGPSVLETTMGKLNKGTKILIAGGYENVFREAFGVVANEKLQDSFACFLSTPSSPIGGQLFVTNHKLAFLSDRPISYHQNLQQQPSWSHYKALLKKFEAWSRKHIGRSQNEEACEATQGMITCVFVVKANARLYHGREMLSKEVEFLLIGILPEGLLSSKKYAFMRNPKKYKMLDDMLYMKGSDLVLRCVPWKEEIYKILEENHEGSCGGHFAMKIMLHKILQEGYMWSSIQRDVNHWCESCLSCQKIGKRILKPELRKTILAFDMFEKWGLDAIGPLPMIGKRKGRASHDES